MKPTVTFSSSPDGAAVQCLPVQLEVACLGVPAAQRKGLRGRRRTFVHKSYLLRWVRKVLFGCPMTPNLQPS